MATNPKYIAMFLKEAKEHLEQLTRGVIALESTAGDQALIHELMRNAHTIKGAARMLALDGIGAIAHHQEDLFKALEAGEESATPALIDLLLAGCDALDGLIGNLAAGQTVQPDVAELLGFLDRRELPPARLLDALRLKTAVATRAVDEVRLPIAALDDLQARLSELLIGKQRFDARLKELKGLTRSAPREFAGLWEFQARLEDDVLELDRELAEINAQILTLRLLPLRAVTEGFVRVVRDVARGQGKQTSLTVLGDDLELDRQILEQLRPAFVHLLTNAVTHGLETPAERTLSGKPETGAITISASLVGDEAAIEFHDDGRGMNPVAIRGHALARGLLTPEQAALLSDGEVLKYALLPGFSTCAAVSDAAGRGVGLDAVQQSLKKVNGTLTIRNEPGRGCAFVLAVPRTLLTTKALLVTSDGERYLIPVTAIEETRNLSRAELVPTADGHSLGGPGPVPVVDLGGLLGRPAGVARSAGERLPAVVLKLRDRRLACLVDTLYDTLDVVVKRLTPQLRKVFLVSGATVLPDGAPVLILNVADLFEAATQSSSLLPLPHAHQKAPQRILVVDDSITSRTLESTILVNQGYLVDVAENGAQAMAKLLEESYRLVVSDVEMPIMDGLTLVAQIRNRFTGQELPVIVMSSLNRAVDRERAMTAGAQAYLTKGEFDQDVFLSCVRQLLE